MTKTQTDRIGIQLTVNGQTVQGQATVQTTLQEFLHHHLTFRDVRYGCGEGVCGACMILLDGEPVASCLLLTVQAQGREIRTATGLETGNGKISAEQFALLREHFIAKESFQCGYCATGMIVTAADALANDAAQLPNPDKPEITNLKSQIPKSFPKEQGFESLDTEIIRHAISGNICRCSGYEQIVEAIEATKSEKKPAQIDHPRNDLYGKLDGTARYPTDHFVENALAGRVLWSAYPHAKIKSIDTSQAQALPGVLAVLTHKDIPGENLAGTNVFVEDMPLLAEGRVRFMGEAVALVAAENEITAREAIRRIRVDYEPLPSVHNELDALKPEAPKIGRRGNAISQFSDIKGDIDRGWREADKIIEDTYSSEINDHTCIEPEGGTGWLEDDTLILRFPSHTQYNARKYVAKALDIPEEKIRVLAPRMGGSFGKYLVTSIEAYLALLVHKTRRAVRLVLDREELLQRSTKRHPFLGHYKLGLKEDGTFVALEADVYTDAGPYVSLTPALISAFAVEADGAYYIPNIKIRARGVLTNNLVPAPMRGFGSQQIGFGIECIVEKAARELGIDPAEIRRKNFIAHRYDGKGNDIPGSKNLLPETLKRVLERMGDRPETSEEGWIIGRGITTIHAKYGYPYGFVDRFTARVSVDQNGDFRIESDISDAGTGFASSMARIVAKHLNLKKAPEYHISQAAIDDPTGHLFSKGKRPSRFLAWLFRLIEQQQTTAAGNIQIFLGGLKFSTYLKLMRVLSYVVNFFNDFINWLKGKIFPYAVDSFIPRINGSRSVMMAGQAALDAARNFNDMALSAAASSLKVSKENLLVTQEGVIHRNDPARSISWVALAKQDGGVLSAMGKSRVPKGKLLDPKTGNQIGPFDHMDATHGCDLAIHPRTGEVRFLRYVACHDVGKILHPETLRGQLLGSIAIGIGQGLLEKIVVENGKVQTDGLHEYHVPTSLDVPAGIELDILESGDGFGPEGAKGIGEAGSVAAPIAIANAIYDAAGIQPKSIPITPEEIVALFEERKKKAE